MIAPSSGAREFDLSTVPRARTDYSRYIRAIAIGVFLIGLGGLIWYWLTIPSSTLLSPGQLLVQGLIAFIATLAGLAAAWLGPGARRCSIDDRGFTLTFGNGKQRRYDWSDPNIRLHLGEVSGKGSISYDLTTRSPVSTRLSQELYLTLLTEARRHGMDVRSSTINQIDQVVTTTHITKSRIVHSPP